MDVIKVILSALLSALSLFIIAKLVGHKQVAQLNFFDYICGITIGSIAAELATELEEPLRPLLAMVIYGGVSVGLSLIMSKLPKSRKYFNGSPTILFKNGKLYRENLKKAKLDLTEFMVMCRQVGYFSLEDIEVAVFEYNGRLSILPKSDRRPLEGYDIGLTPQKAALNTEIIMDGRIMGENLRRLGFDDVWLEKELKKQGFNKASEIFLGIYDGNKLTLYSGN